MEKQEAHELMERCDQSLMRIPRILHLPTIGTADSVSDEVYDLFFDNDHALAPLVEAGLEFDAQALVAEGYDHRDIRDDFGQAIYRAGLGGWLLFVDVQVVKRFWFKEDGDYSGFRASWGWYSTHVVYDDVYEEALGKAFAVADAQFEESLAKARMEHDESSQKPDEPGETRQIEDVELPAEGK